MTWESGSTDQQRLRAGYAVLMIGVVILLLAWGMAVERGPLNEGDVAVRREKLDPPVPSRRMPVVGAGMMLTGLCLIAILVISIFAFIRISRNYRDRLLREPPRPSPTTDIWQMHKVPDMPDMPENEDDENHDEDESRPV